MSRSYRKPYFGNSYGGSKKWASGARKWKREANRALRRLLEIANNSIYKRIKDVWVSPLEHARGYWDKPEMRRK